MEQRPEFMNEAGEKVYRCIYTKVLVPESKAVAVGAVIPGLSAKYFMANTDEAKAAHKRNLASFHGNDRNCNTCIHLERVKHEKCKYGLLKGKCKSQEQAIQYHPYAHRFDEQTGIMTFHPHDAMNMPCYVSRFANG